MTAGANISVPIIAGLLNTIIDELGAQDRRNHERRMKDLQIIESSSLKDEYVRQLLLDRLLYPIEQAQHDIQDTAKHAQWLSQIILFYHQEHGLTEEQAHELARELKLLAIQITHVDTLHDLRFVYSVTTIFSDKVSVFKHEKLEYRLEYNIREKILNRLNNCIAAGNNFRVKKELMQLMSGKSVAELEPSD